MTSEEKAPPPPPPIPPPPMAPDAPGTRPKEFNTQRDTFEAVRVHFAINDAAIADVRELAASGSNLNFAIYGNTPLTLALVKEHYDIAHVLIDAGADVTLSELMAWKRQPLHLVAKEGQLDLVTKVVSRGAVVDAQDSSGMTPLMWAALGGHADSITSLIGSGADIHLVDEVGRSALFRAVEGSHIAIVRKLMEAGAQIDQEDMYGWTPLFQAVVCNDFDMVNELLTFGASVTHTNRLGQTVLHLLANRLANDNLLTLCRTDTNFYIRDRQVSCTASKHAINNPGYELPISELLLDHGANVNVTDHRQVTPLLVAALEGNADLVHALVRAGADVHREDWVGVEAWPAKLAPCVETCRWLRAQWEAGIKPLQDLCRLVIRRTLGRNINAKVKQLPLPVKLFDFLSL